jgi:hypothetical protein
MTAQVPAIGRGWEVSALVAQPAVGGVEVAHERSHGDWHGDPARSTSAHPRVRSMRLMPAWPGRVAAGCWTAVLLERLDPQVADFRGGVVVGG